MMLEKVDCDLTQIRIFKTSRKMVTNKIRANYKYTERKTKKIEQVELVIA